MARTGQRQIKFTKNLCDPLTLDILDKEKDGVFQQGDKNAHVLRIELMDGAGKADLSGMTATGQFERGDGSRATYESATISDNVVNVTLSENCYNVAGAFVAFVRLSSVAEDGKNYLRRTILRVAGMIEPESDGPLVDSGSVLPSMDELVVRLEAMERATEACNTATVNANDAAEAANKAAAEADGWANAVVSASTLEGGSDATVTVVTREDKTKIINFGIPAGVTPNITFEVETGAPGSDVQMVQSGTIEAPRIKLTIPRGDTGAVDGIDYYTGAPAALGVASPGTANGVARGNHVHPMPTAEQIPVNGTDDVSVAAAMITYAQGQKAASGRLDALEALDALKYRFLTGSVTVACEAGAVKSEAVTFPEGFFSSSPTVIVSLHTNATAVLDGGNCATSAITASGFTINAFRPTAGNVPVRWLAFVL